MSVKAGNSMLLTSASRGRATLLAAVLSILALFFLFRSDFVQTASWPTSKSSTSPIIHTTTTPKSPHPRPSSTSRPSNGDIGGQAPLPSEKGPCTDFPDTSDILLIMKTGGTEAYDKLPIHFMTTLQCMKDVIIFSDMEMQMGQYHIIDALKGVDESIKKDNPDFDLYTQLKESERLGEDPRNLKDGFSGWNLDKYKFLPMFAQTWKYRQDAKWYIYVEADTGMNWSNLRKFLDMLDPKQPLYVGSPTYLDIEFAHGGTGYILSGAAMEQGIGKHPDMQDKYDKTVHDICCGDRMIAKVLEEEKIKLTKAWPMLNGEKPLTVPFTEAHWCAPILTMHHMTAQEVSQVWNFEQQRKADGNHDPIVWKDIYNHFVHDSLLPLREDWSNLSNDMTYTPDPDRDFHGLKWKDLSELERASAESPDNCKKLCESEDSCMQWEHHDKECKMARSIKLGGTRKPEGNARWVSGWRFDRIAAFRQKMGNCSEGAVWKWTEPQAWE